MSNPKGNLASLKPYQPKWQAGPTRTIRVPIVLADSVLEYAHKLDSDTLSQVNGYQSSSTHPDTEVDSTSYQATSSRETLTQVIDALEEVYQTPRNNFNRERKSMLREAIRKLETLTQVK